MTRRLFLSVAANHCAVIAVSGTRIEWQATATGEAAHDSVRELEKLLRSARIPRWRRPQVVLALWPDRSQLRRLPGLPHGQSSSVLDALVRENAGRFFLRSDEPMLISRAVPGADGSHWAAALDAPVVDAVRGALRGVGLRLDVVVPALSLVSAPLMGFQATRSNGLLQLVTRVPMAAPDLADVEEVVCSLALADLSHAPVLAPETLQHPSGRQRLVSGAAVAAAIGAVILAPGLGALHAASKAERDLREIAPIAEGPLGAQAEALSFASALAEFDSLYGRQTPRLAILSELTRLLPDSAVLLGVQLDSSQGRITVLSPRTTVLLEALETAHTMSDARLVGPVTREVVGTRMLERAAIMFRAVPVP